jgi:hypothetical protein
VPIWLLRSPLVLGKEEKKKTREAEKKQILRRTTQILAGRKKNLIFEAFQVLFSSIMTQSTNTKA